MDPERRNILSVWDTLVKQIGHRYTSGYERVRYCPLVLFWLEAASKTAFLVLVSYVAVFDYGALTDPDNDSPWDELSYTNRDILVIVFLVSTILRELGEYEGTTLSGAAETPSVANSTPVIEKMIRGLYRHFFNNIWNFLDLTGIVLVASWAVMKGMSSYKVYARGCLTSAAMPMALSLLRYAAIEKEMGSLVITLVSMSRDFYSFLVIYIVSIYGFGVALRGLFQHDHANEGEEESIFLGFSTFTGSFLTLLDATMGQHDYEQLSKDNDYIYLGLVIEVVFLLLTMVILFNLLIAKMSSTYAKSEENALEEWEYSKATIVEQFVLVGEASPLNALPAPLNLITFLVYIPHHLLINKVMYGVWLRSNYSPPKNIDSHTKILLANKQVYSIGGTLSDWILAFLAAPIIGLAEIFSDIFNITVDVWRHHSDFMKKYMRDKKTGDLKRSFVDPATIASIQLLGFAILHITLICLVSPFCLIYYSIMTVYNAVRTPVKLQLYSEEGPWLQIVYPTTDSARYEPKRSFQKQNFIGNFIRGELSRHGSPYEDRTTYVRCTAGPYTARTSAATTTVTNTLAWKVSGEEPKNTKNLVSFAQNRIELPLFPFSDDDLLTHLDVEIVEVHSAGDITIASSHIHGMQLHRWALDGRFEGKLIMLNHTGIPDHIVTYAQNHNYPEKVIIFPTVYKGERSRLRIVLKYKSMKKKSPTCEIHRKGANLSDPMMTLHKGSAVTDPMLITSVVFDPKISCDIDLSDSEDFGEIVGSHQYQKNDKFKTFHIYYGGHFYTKNNLQRA